MNIRIGLRGLVAESELFIKNQHNKVDMDEFAPDKLTDLPLELVEDPVAMQNAKECAFSAICDGYTHLVYNFVRSGQT